MPTPRKPPAAVSRRQALAAQWSQRAGLFKARNDMGPVRVELARCTCRWFWLTLSTQSWQKEAELMARIEAMPQSGTSVDHLLRVFNGWRDPLWTGSP